MKIVNLLTSPTKKLLLMGVLLTGLVTPFTSVNAALNGAQHHELSALQGEKNSYTFDQLNNAALNTNLHPHVDGGVTGGIAISGKIVALNGTTPVSGACINVGELDVNGDFQQARDANGESVVASTGLNGTYSITGLALNKFWLVEVINNVACSSAGLVNSGGINYASTFYDGPLTGTTGVPANGNSYGSESTQFYAAAPASYTNINIREVQGFTMSGNIFTPTGDPAAYVCLLIKQIDPTRQAQGTGYEGTFQTDGLGEYSISGLADGVFTIGANVGCGNFDVTVNQASNSITAGTTLIVNGNVGVHQLIAGNGITDGTFITGSTCNNNVCTLTLSSPITGTLHTGDSLKAGDLESNWAGTFWNSFSSTGLGTTFFSYRASGVRVGTQLSTLPYAGTGSATGNAENINIKLVQSGTISGYIYSGVRGLTYNQPIKNACVQVSLAQPAVTSTGRHYVMYQEWIGATTDINGLWSLSVPITMYDETGRAVPSKWVVFAQAGNCDNGDGPLAPSPFGNYSAQYYNGTPGQSRVALKALNPSEYGTILEIEATAFAFSPPSRQITGINEFLGAGGVITGKITQTSNGNGAYVCLRIGTATPTNAYGDIRESGNNGFGIGIRTNSNGDGFYTASGLPAGDYVIFAYGCIAGQPNFNPGYYNGTAAGTTNESAQIPVHVNAGGTTSGINLSLGIAGAISGTVKDFRSGTETPGGLTNVCAEVGTFDNGQFINQFNARGSSGDGGQYTIFGIPAGQYYVEFVTGDCGRPWDNGTAPANQFYSGNYSASPALPSTGTSSSPNATPTLITVRAGETTQHVDVNMQDGSGSISGTVSSEHVSDFSGMLVVATDTLAANPLRFITQVEGGTYSFANLPTDASNTFTILFQASAVSGRPSNGYFGNDYDFADTYYVQGASHTHGTTNAADATKVRATSSGAIGKNLIEIETGAIQGHVVASDEFSSINNACVTISSSNSNGPSYSTTVNFGDFYVGGIIPGTYNLRVGNCSGDSKFVTYTSNSIPISAEDGSHGPTQLDDIVLQTVSGTGTISGTLYDSSGYFAPITGTLPSSVSSSGGGAAIETAGSTTLILQSGTPSISSFYPDEPVYLRDQNFNTFVGSIKSSPSSPYTSVELNITNYYGSPTVVAAGWTLIPQSSGAKVCVTAVGSRGSYSTLTDGQGRYTISGVPTGSYNVIFADTNNCVGSSDYYPVTYYAGFASGAANSGLLTKPIFAYSATGTATTNYLTSVTSTVNVNPASGSADCDASSQYCKGVSENVSAVLTVLGSIAGKVTGANDVGMSNVCVTVFSAAGDYLSKQTGADGTWRLNSVAAGAYRIQINSAECTGSSNPSYKILYYDGQNGSLTQSGSAIVYMTSGSLVSLSTMVLSASTGSSSGQANSTNVPAPPASASALIPIDGSLVNGAQLTWSPVTDGGTDGTNPLKITNYIVKTYDVSGVSSSVPQANILDGLSAQATLTVQSTCNFECTMNVFGLIPGRAYVFTVQATNSVRASGPSQSNEVLTIGAPILSSTAATASAGTATAPALNTGGTSYVSASASGGVGSIALGSYQSNPVGSASGLSAPTSYFDVGTSAGASFTGSTFQVCGLTSGQAVFWFNPITQSFVKASQQTPESGGCSTVTVSATTTPSTQQLYGAVFSTATAPVVAPPSSGGGGFVAPVQPTITVPTSPSNAVATVSGTSVTITWTAPVATSTSSPVTGYVVSAQGTLNPITCTTTTALTCTISGLAAAPYTFSVIATSATGNSSAAQTNTVTVAAPTTAGTGTGTTGSGTTGSGGTTPVTPVASPVKKGAPAALSIKATSSVTGAVSIVLTKSPVPGTKAITSYQYSTGAGVWRTVYAVHGAFTIKGLKSGKTYAVQLRAVSAIGAGAASKPYSVKIK